MNLAEIIFFSIFGLFLVFYLVYSWLILYHINRYGYKEGGSKKMMAAYCLVSISIIVLTVILALSVKWEFSSKSLNDSINIPLLENIFK